MCALEMTAQTRTTSTTHIHTHAARARTHTHLATVAVSSSPTHSVMTVPGAPFRAVRPARCTYSLAVPGGDTFTTRSTFLKSRPRDPASRLSSTCTPKHTQVIIARANMENTRVTISCVRTHSSLKDIAEYDCGCTQLSTHSVQRTTPVHDQSMRLPECFHWRKAA